MMSMHLKRKRSGMTLIEIMVVIAIIAVLVSLTVAGIMAVFIKGTDAQNRFDIQRLSEAVERFKAAKHMYPPNVILLHANSADYSKPGPHSKYNAESLLAITKIWPDLIDPNTGGFTNLNWAGFDEKGVAIPIPASGIFLEGDQCLVFFLAGVPKVDMLANPPIVMGMLGFSTTGVKDAAGKFVRDPTAPPDIKNAKGGDREKFFEFEVSRLYFRDNQPANARCLIPSYNDRYSVADSRFLDKKVPKKVPEVNKVSARPFVYFSSTQLGNAPNAYDPKTWITELDNVSPYVEKKSLPTDPVQKAPIYCNSNTFQIISAGKDGVFGPGSTTAVAPALTQKQWTPGQYPGAGQDDMSNFWSNFLNVP